MYLDTTVTKFLEQSQDDIAVTKYLNGPAEFQENDISVTKFLDSSEDGIAVTKYLGQRSNDIVVTMFQNLDTTVTKFLGDYDITIIEFLDTVLPKYLEDNDISVTKFLDSSVGQFLDANDISVTKFLNDEADNDISVTKFLTDTAVSNFPLFGHREHQPAPLTPRKEPHNSSWEEDLMRHERPDRREYPEHRPFEYARTVYPHEDRRESPESMHRLHEHARTVYPHED